MRALALVSLLTAAAVADTEELDRLALEPDASKVPMLIQALAHGDSAVRWRAAWALSRLGAAAKPAVEPLLTTLADKNEAARYAAVAVLRNFPQHDLFLQHLVDKSAPPQARVAAGIALVQSGHRALAADRIANAFHRGPHAVRLGLAPLLGRCGRRPAVEVLIRWMKQERLHAVIEDALIGIGRRALPQLEAAAAKKYTSRHFKAGVERAAARIRASLAEPAMLPRVLGPRELLDEYRQLEAGRRISMEPPRNPPKAHAVEAAALGLGHRFRTAPRNVRHRACEVLERLAQDRNPHLAVAALLAGGKLRVFRRHDAVLPREGLLAGADLDEWSAMVGDYRVRREINERRSALGLPEWSSERFDNRFFLEQWSRVRITAMWMCVRCELDGPELRRKLRAMTKDRRKAVRSCAIATLWFLGESHANAKLHVIATLRREEWAWRVQDLIPRLGEQPLQFLPGLVAHPAAVRGLGKAAFPTLKIWLREPRHRADALAAIRALGKSAAELAPDVLAAPIEPAECIAVLRELGEPAVVAAKAARTAPDPRTRDRAEQFLAAVNSGD